ncbi:hypothetical protein [Haloarchaeobius sp. TZWWS8]|uniref:hypothetical protein n=1 Tax=Haloarchaeobius sp. TZWWS8 TaxID=3446121 RepID=UPI003EC0E2AC
MPDSSSKGGDTSVERGSENRWKLWLLIQAPRSVLSVMALAGLFCGLIALEVHGPSTLQKFLSGDELASLFSAIVGAIITSVTLILTVTQLVISQEIGSLSEQNRRLEQQSDFRNNVEDTIGLEVSPSEPATFFRALLEATLQCCREIVDRVEPVTTDEEEAVAEFARGVAEHGEKIQAELKGSEFGSFRVLSAVLDFNYSVKINEARQLRSTHGNRLEKDVTETISDLIETLRFFGPTRGFFKTLYFQWELINVSRAMVYAALPGLAIAGYMIVAFDPQQVVGTVGGIQSLYLVTSAAYALTLVPFVLLLAYIVRILSVLKRTLAPGSFVLRETNETEEILWAE